MKGEDFNNGFKIGIYLGIGVMILLLSYIRFKRRKLKKSYHDERQEKIRGIAFRYGFYAMIYWMIGASFLEFLLGKHLFDTLTFPMITILLGVGVNVVFSILNGSYFYVNMNRKKYILFLLAFTIMNIITSVVVIISGGVISEDMLTYKSLNILVAILLIVTLLAIYIRDRAEKMFNKRNDD